MKGSLLLRDANEKQNPNKSFDEDEDEGEVPEEGIATGFEDNVRKCNLDFASQNSFLI